MNCTWKPPLKKVGKEILPKWQNNSGWRILASTSPRLNSLAVPLMSLSTKMLKILEPMEWFENFDCPEMNHMCHEYWTYWYYYVEFTSENGSFVSNLLNWWGGALRLCWVAKPCSLLVEKWDRMGPKGETTLGSHSFMTTSGKGPKVFLKERSVFDKTRFHWIMMKEEQVLWNFLRER